MKVIQQNNNSSNTLGDEIGEAFLEISSDGKDVYLSSIDNNGGITRYLHLTKKTTNSVDVDYKID